MRGHRAAGGSTGLAFVAGAQLALEDGQLRAQPLVVGAQAALSANRVSLPGAAPLACPLAIGHRLRAARGSAVASAPRLGTAAWVGCRATGARRPGEATACRRGDRRRSRRPTRVRQRRTGHQHQLRALRRQLAQPAPLEVLKTRSSSTGSPTPSKRRSRPTTPPPRPARRRSRTLAARATGILGAGVPAEGVWGFAALAWQGARSTRQRVPSAARPAPVERDLRPGGSGLAPHAQPAGAPAPRMPSSPRPASGPPPSSLPCSSGSPASTAPRRPRRSTAGTPRPSSTGCCAKPRRAWPGPDRQAQGAARPSAPRVASPRPSSAARRSRIRAPWTTRSTKCARLKRRPRSTGVERRLDRQADSHHHGAVRVRDSEIDGYRSTAA